MKATNGVAKRTTGFTLVEVMIVAILAAISYPSYLGFVRKGWRAEARAALMQQMQQQERQYTLAGQYRALHRRVGRGRCGRQVSRRKR